MRSETRTVATKIDRCLDKIVRSGGTGEVFVRIIVEDNKIKRVKVSNEESYIPKDKEILGVATE